MPKIGVVVTKSVLIDRDGARSLLRTYSGWLNQEIPLQDRSIEQEDVEEFLKRYADVTEGTSDG